MKLSKKVIIKVEFSGKSLEIFKQILYKATAPDQQLKLGLGVLNEEEKALMEELNKTFKK
jgi:hypothetical protein